MDNKLWFKNKTYGCGWTPVSWQGWAVTIGYLILIIALGFTIDENSTIREMMFIYFLPVVILTTALIRICYKKGEKPRWQWGKKDQS